MALGLMSWQEQLRRGACRGLGPLGLARHFAVEGYFTCRFFLPLFSIVTIQFPKPLPSGLHQSARWPLQGARESQRCDAADTEELPSEKQKLGSRGTVPILNSKNSVRYMKKIFFKKEQLLELTKIIRCWTLYAW